MRLFFYYGRAGIGDLTISSTISGLKFLFGPQDCATHNVCSPPQHWGNHCKEKKNEATFVSLNVFDMLGRSAATLVEEPKAAGTYSIQFDGSGLASGICLYRLSTPEKTLVRVMTLTK